MPVDVRMTETEERREKLWAIAMELREVWNKLDDLQGELPPDHAWRHTLDIEENNVESSVATLKELADPFGERGES